MKNSLHFTKSMRIEKTLHFQTVRGQPRVSHWIALRKTESFKLMNSNLSCWSLHLELNECIYYKIFSPLMISQVSVFLKITCTFNPFLVMCGSSSHHIQGILIVKAKSWPKNCQFFLCNTRFHSIANLNTDNPKIYLIITNKN